MLMTDRTHPVLLLLSYSFSKKIDMAAAGDGAGISYRSIGEHFIAEAKMPGNRTRWSTPIHRPTEREVIGIYGDTVATLRDMLFSFPCAAARRALEARARARAEISAMLRYIHMP